MGRSLAWDAQRSACARHVTAIDGASARSRRPAARGAPVRIRRAGDGRAWRAAARASGAPAAAGLLVSLRDVSLHVDYLDDLSRDVQVLARRLLADGASWQYTFRATHESALLAEGRAAVIAIGPP